MSSRGVVSRVSSRNTQEQEATSVAWLLANVVRVVEGQGFWLMHDGVSPSNG